MCVDLYANVFLCLAKVMMTLFCLEVALLKIPLSRCCVEKEKGSLGTYRLISLLNQYLKFFPFKLCGHIIFAVELMINIFASPHIPKNTMLFCIFWQWLKMFLLPVLNLGIFAPESVHHERVLKKPLPFLFWIQ